MWCAVCGAPVFKSARTDGWFHDIWPRWLATVARQVTDSPSAISPAGRQRTIEVARLP